MKRKSGFTLAEVLITLAVIGVVAALTMPILFQNATTQKIGPSLAKFVNTFTNAVRPMMLEQSMDYLDNNVKDNIQLLANKIDMMPFAKDNYIFKDGNKSAAITISFKEDPGLESGSDDKDTSNDKGSLPFGWQLKDGTVMVVNPITDPTTITNKGIYKGIIAEILVDIDGDRSLNMAGNDVFAFLLDRSGALIPAGSELQKFLEFAGGDYVGKFDLKCSVNSKIIAENLACTGVIAENGWSTTGLDLF